MDPRDYRDARWHSLLREAEDLGVDEAEAPRLVERVLGAEHRRIRRATDPDPIVRAALHEAVIGPREPRRRGRTVLIAAAALALLLGAAAGYRALTHPDPPPADHLRADQVPSLFGYDGLTAAEVLKDRGLEVRVQPFQACEIQGRVIGVEPPPGTTYQRGDAVTVFTAIPSDVTCLPDYVDRELAWRWIDFATGRGGAPAFASHVVARPGDGTRIVLTGREATDPASWAGAGMFGPIVRAVEAVSLVTDRPVAYAVPSMRVVRASDGAGRCGVPSRAAGGSDRRAAVSTAAIAILVGPADRSGCPLRIELDRDAERRVESVTLYPAP